MNKDVITELFTLKRDYVDQHGLVVQRDHDGGDSAYRTALAIMCCKLLFFNAEAERYLSDLYRTCYMGNGIWRRHPDLEEWYSEPKTFSRDQMAKVILCLLMMGEKWFVQKWFIAQAKRFFLHQNTVPNGKQGIGKTKFPDIMSPGEWANLIRGFSMWYLYPVLMLLDLRMLADLYFRKKTPWDYDSLMAIDLVFSQIQYPTPASKVACHFYKKTDYRERIRFNYSYNENGIPPLGELYVYVCERYL